VPSPPTFAAATSVQSAGAGLWAATITPGWDIGSNANGGYLLAIAARALLLATNRPDPVTITVHYLSPGKPGPVEIATSIIKQGRRFATATATLSADGRPVLIALGTLGDLEEAAGPELVDVAPPDLPPPDACIALEETTFTPPFVSRVEIRLHPDDASFATGDPSGRPLIRGWFRLRRAEPLDTVALLCAVDAFPPTAFNTGVLTAGWTPTVELTAHVRGRPEPGWLRCRFATHFVTRGFLEEEGEVWDATGRLVAQSRQLALVPRS
jgi:acyl-coenzyme A thioesterase PaaI-like protein